jgi:hypothetical protein
MFRSARYKPQQELRCLVSQTSRKSPLIGAANKGFQQPNLFVDRTFVYGTRDTTEASEMMTNRPKRRLAFEHLLITWKSSGRYLGCRRRCRDRRSYFDFCLPDLSGGMTST